MNFIFPKYLKRNIYYKNAITKQKISLVIYTSCCSKFFVVVMKILIIESKHVKTKGF